MFNSKEGITVILLLLALIFFGGKIVLEIFADWDYFGRLFADTLRFLFITSAREDLGERVGRPISRWYIFRIFLKMLTLPDYLRCERDYPKLEMVYDVGRFLQLEDMGEKRIVMKCSYCGSDKDVIKCPALSRPTFYCCDCCRNTLVLVCKGKDACERYKKIYEEIKEGLEQRKEQRRKEE